MAGIFLSRFILDQKMYLAGYNENMEYELRSTKTVRQMVSPAERLFGKNKGPSRLKNGNFGDCKHINPSLFEPLFSGSGSRIYYTVQGGTIVLLVAGGDKSTRKVAIENAVSILQQLGDKQ